MNYVLAMQFEYHRYQQDALIKIYADNVFVNQMRLNEDINLRAIDVNSLPAPPDHVKHTGPKNYSQIFIIPEKIFLYTIDERYLGKSIRIEIENDFNNYNNGFMTDYAYIRWHQLAIMPEWVLDRKHWPKLKRFRSLGYPLGAQLWPKVPDRKEIILTSEKKEWGVGFYFMKRGGNFKLEIPLTRKHGIIHPGNSPFGRLYFAHDFPRQVMHYK